MWYISIKREIFYECTLKKKLVTVLTTYFLHMHTKRSRHFYKATIFIKVQYLPNILHLVSYYSQMLNLILQQHWRADQLPRVFHIINKHENLYLNFPYKFICEYGTQQAWKFRQLFFFSSFTFAYRTSYKLHCNWSEKYSHNCRPSCQHPTLIKYHNFINFR